MSLALGDWAAIGAIISAMCDVITLGRETFEYYYEQRLKDFHSPQRGAVLQAAFSTYTDRDIEAIKERIEGCRDRYIKEGGGAGGSVCLCSVLTDVRDGNGGQIPEIDNWPEAYEILHCN